MRFNITAIDPDGYKYGHFLHDIIKLFCAGIEAAGYDCKLSKNNFDADRVNIVIGAHLMSNPATVRQLATAGIQYVVYNSEIVNPSGINTAGKRDHLDRVFLPLLRGARAVWDCNQSNVGALARYGIQASWLEPGYHPVLEEIRHKKNKDIDFLWYGSMTENRRQLLVKLQSAGFKVAAVFDPTAMYRNDLIARAKVNLVPRQGAGMDQLPYWRIVYQLHNRCSTVVEECREQRWLQDCFEWAPSATYLELCARTLLRPDRQECADAHYERFRQRPMAGFLTPLLEALATSEAGGGTP